MNSPIALPPTSMDLIKRLLMENGRRYLPRYAVALLLMSLVAAMTAASAWMLKSIINDILVARNAPMIGVIAGAVLVIYTVKGLADYGQSLLMNSVGQDIVADQQKRLYGHLLTQGLDYFSTTSLGDVVARVSYGAVSVRQVLDLLIATLGKDLLSIIGLVTVMVIQDPVLSVFALMVMPAALLGVRTLVKRIRSMGHAEYQAATKIISNLKDTVLGIRVVKSFGMEERMQAEMDRAIDANAARARRIANLSARTSPLMESLAGVAIALIIAYTGYGIIHWGRDPGSVIAFLAAMLLAYEPAKRLARLNLNLEEALVGVRMIYAFLDQKSTMLDRPDAVPLVVGKGQLEFRDVTFRYGAKPALSDLTVTFPPGKVSALVGPSGAGKSTVFSLIERFYDPQSGQVLIDGQDIRQVTLASLRSNIAYVTQEAFLFEGTIRDNILAGKPDATEAEMIAAATAAHAHEFILDFPEGYDRQTGEGGANLSGGQRQRVAIARAMLRDAPILLLDEATSALDAESEAKVKEALDRLMVGRTTIVIAHRLSTVRNADVIHVLDGGRLVESGTHAELVARGGVYGRLSALQFASEPRKAQRRASPAPAA